MTALETAARFLQHAVARMARRRTPEQREARRQRNVDIQRNRRAVARSSGMCGSCIHRSAIHGTTACEVCTSGREKYKPKRVVTGERTVHHVSTLTSFHECCAMFGFHRADCRDARLAVSP